MTTQVKRSAISALGAISGALVILVTVGVHAQPGDTGASGAMKPASSAKELRAADRALQKSVRRALAKTKGLEMINIVVRARNGAVVLEGTVPEQSQIDVATHAAQDVAGVTSVRNALTIHIPQ